MHNSDDEFPIDGLLACQDHIQEIIDRWLVIDDEIWAKIICMEKNRRIAKAYARRHSLTINGSEDEYLDGTTLGLNSFENPERTSKTRYIKQYIGQGLKINITPEGDIVAKRLSKSSVFVHRATLTMAADVGRSAPGRKWTSGANSSSSNGLSSRSSGEGLYARHEEPSDFYALNCAPKSLHTAKVAGVFSREFASRNGDKSGDAKSRSSSLATSAGWPNNNTKGNQLNSSSDQFAALDYGKSIKIFDMDKFRHALEQESRRACPDRRRLQRLCIAIASFVVDDQSILNLPSWVMIINMVAIDLIRAELRFLELGPGPLLDRPLLAREHAFLASSQPLDAAYDHRDFSSSGSFLYHSVQAPEVENQDDDDEHMLLSRPKNPDRFKSQQQEHQHQPQTTHLGGASASSSSSSGSSSGFDSHASSASHKAGSSSSPSSSAKEGELSGQATRRGESPEPGIVKAATAKLLASGNCITTPAPLKSKVSQPFPILAPPTSPGSCPSGKANLILVSPTGLSPPITKRKINKQTTMMSQLSSSLDSCASSSGSSGPGQCGPSRSQVPQFSTIKHIDESGQCQVLLDENCQPPAGPLPNGIPAHAKLAPPETQKHIIRYLMSAHRGKSSRATSTTTSATTTTTTNATATATNQATTAPISASSMKPNANKPAYKQQLASSVLITPFARPPASHRPLPVLPAVNYKYKRVASGSGKQASCVDDHPDETLYYRGMQARVPVGRAPPTGLSNGGRLPLATKLHAANKMPALHFNYNYVTSNNSTNQPVAAKPGFPGFGSNLDPNHHDGQVNYRPGRMATGSGLNVRINGSKEQTKIGNSNNDNYRSPSSNKCRINNYLHQHQQQQQQTSPGSCCSIRSLSVDNLNGLNQNSSSSGKSGSSLLTHLIPFSRFRKSSNQQQQQISKVTKRAASSTTKCNSNSHLNVASSAAFMAYD